MTDWVKALTTSVTGLVLVIWTVTGGGFNTSLLLDCLWMAGKLAVIVGALVGLTYVVIPSDKKGSTPKITLPFDTRPLP